MRLLPPGLVLRAPCCCLCIGCAAQHAHACPPLLACPVSPSASHNLLPHLSHTSLTPLPCAPRQELILFSRADLERSIPSMVDGLKPGQRKILFCAFKRNLNKDIKVMTACD